MEVFDARGFQNTGAARAGREESHNPDPWAVGGFFLTDSEFLSHIYDQTCVIKAIVNHTAFCVNSVPFLFIFIEISNCKILVFLTTFLLCPSLWAGLGGPLYGFFCEDKTCRNREYDWKCCNHIFVCLLPIESNFLQKISLFVTRLI